MQFLPTPHGKRIKVLCSVGFLLSAVVFGSYSNTLNNFFLDDDFTSLIIPFFIHNGSITRFLASRPVEFGPNIFAYFFWACIAKVFGSSYFYHHLTMVVLHISAVYLFFLYIKRLSGNFRLAFYAAVLCAASYVCAETVARVMHMQYLLATVCSLMCLLLSLSEKPFHRIISFIAFLLALMSKEIALVIPFIMLISDCIFRGIQERHKKGKFNLVFFIAVIFYLVIRFSHPQPFGSSGFLLEGKLPYLIFFREHGLVSGIALYCYKLMTIPLKYILFSVNSFVFGGATFFLKAVLAVLIVFPIALYIKSGIHRFLTDRIILFAVSWVLSGSLPFFCLLDSIDYNKGGLINTRYLYFASMGLWLILARSLEQLYESSVKGKKTFVSAHMIITVLLSSAVLYGNNYAYQYAAGVAKEIPLQTQKKFPLFAGANPKLYFVNVNDELSYAKGVHLFKNGGLDGAFLLTCGFLPKVSIVDKKEYNDRLRKFGFASEQLLPEINLSKALSEGYVLRWNEASHTIVDGTGS